MFVSINCETPISMFHVQHAVQNSFPSAARNYSTLTMGRGIKRESEGLIEAGGPSDSACIGHSSLVRKRHGHQKSASISEMVAGRVRSRVET